MGRKKDRFWEYAHPESNNRFKCNFCNDEFAGGISRIKSQLSGIKGRDIDICLKVPGFIRVEAQQVIGGPCYSKRKGKMTISISDDDENENVFVATGSSHLNKKGGKSCVAPSNDGEIVGVEAEPSSATLLLSSSSRESRKEELDKQFLKCYQIADAVSKEASQLLVQLVKGVSGFGPNYELPNILTPPHELILEHEQHLKESWSETSDSSDTTIFSVLLDAYRSTHEV